jgi:hypothetical protein
VHLCLPDDYAGCWPREPEADTKPGADADQQQAEPERKQHHCRACDECDLQHDTGCLEPDCPCGGMVPLALLDPRRSHTITVDGREEQYCFTIDTRGRRKLPPPREWLTHIVETNWTHGEVMPLSKLNRELGWRLSVRFDRRIREADAKTGISPFTFVVQYWGQQHDLEFITAVEGSPSLDKDDECLAVFEIPADMRRLASNVVLVTLKCNFILDCHDNAVDGDFLRGEFPTGDGTEGGTFESWFSVE